MKNRKLVGVITLLIIIAGCFYFFYAFLPVMISGAINAFSLFMLLAVIGLFVFLIVKVFKYFFK